MTKNAQRVILATGVLAGLVLGCRGLFSGAGGAPGSDPKAAGVPPALFAGGPGSFGAETNAGGPGGSSRFSTNANTPAEMETFSFFTQSQIDPADEDTAGPKFVVSGDIDNDGLLDLASGWNQSQPVQIHLQRRDADGRITFQTVTLAGTSPVTIMGSLKLGDIDGDGFLDVAMAIKNTGFIRFCVPNAPDCNDVPDVIDADEGLVGILFSPGDAALITNGDNWEEVVFEASRLSGRRDIPAVEEPVEPEFNSYTDIELGEIDGVNGLDIIVAFNPAECECDGELPPNNRVDLYPNPGPGQVRNGDSWLPIRIQNDAPYVKDTALLDVEGDGDLDVVVTYPSSISRNVRWVRNPLVPHTPGGIGGTAAVLTGEATWQHRPVGQLDPRADVLAIGDIDFDGHDDVMVRGVVTESSLSSGSSGIVQWFRSPNTPQREPINPPDPVPGRFDFPWQVYTMAEFADRVPEGIGLGDITGDGQLDAVVGVEGAIVWYDATPSGSVFVEWVESPIIRDSAPDDPSLMPGVDETSTFINNVLIVDLDGDGFSDIVGTLDRRTGSGVSNDVLVWYRNNLGQRPQAGP